MKKIYIFLIAAISVRMCHSMGASEDAMQNLTMRFNWLSQSAAELDFVDIVNDTEFGAPRKSVSADDIKKQATLLLEDIDALMQRYPDTAKNLQEKFENQYKNSFEKKCKSVFGEFAQGEKPQNNFYSWIQEIGSNYSDISTKFKNFSGEHIKALTHKIYEDVNVDRDVKMCLRELMTHFASPYSQQNYDEYLAGSSNKLTISKKTHDELLAMYTDIQQILVNLYS